MSGAALEVELVTILCEQDPPQLSHGFQIKTFSQYFQAIPWLGGVNTAHDDIADRLGLFAGIIPVPLGVTEGQRQSICFPVKRPLVQLFLWLGICPEGGADHMMDSRWLKG